MVTLSVSYPEQVPEVENSKINERKKFLITSCGWNWVSDSV